MCMQPIKVLTGRGITIRVEHKALEFLLRLLAPLIISVWLSGLSILLSMGSMWFLLVFSRAACAVKPHVAPIVFARSCINLHGKTSQILLRGRLLARCKRRGVRHALKVTGCFASTDKRHFSPLRWTRSEKGRRARVAGTGRRKDKHSHWKPRQTVHKIRCA